MNIFESTLNTCEEIVLENSDKVKINIPKMSESLMFQKRTRTITVCS